MENPLQREENTTKKGLSYGFFFILHCIWVNPFLS
jgi:hypothetical protein